VCTLTRDCETHFVAERSKRSLRVHTRSLLPDCEMERESVCEREMMCVCASEGIRRSVARVRVRIRILRQKRRETHMHTHTHTHAHTHSLLHTLKSIRSLAVGVREYASVSSLSHTHTHTHIHASVSSLSHTHSHTHTHTHIQSRCARTSE